jgi:hypothetical protein
MREEAGWTDGWPIVPPSEAAVARFLEAAGRSPEAEVLRLDHLGRTLSVRLAAVNAVMAGCLPEYFPVVLAAFEAIAMEGLAAAGAWQSTTGGAPLFVLNGPLRHALGFNSRGDVFGSGYRANATAGRAVRLIIQNVFSISPHHLDQSTQGTPAKYSCFVAENEEESPWNPLHTDFGYSIEESVVSCIHIRGIDFIDNRQARDPMHLLQDIANSITRTGAQVTETAYPVVVLGPEHALLLDRNGLSKSDVKRRLWELAVRPYADLRAAGKEAVAQPLGWRRPAPSDTAIVGTPEFVRLVAEPEDITVLVAGAANAGVSAVVHTVGRSLGPQFRGWGHAPVRAPHIPGGDG